MGRSIQAGQPPVADGTGLTRQKLELTNDPGMGVIRHIGRRVREGRADRQGTRCPRADRGIPMAQIALAWVLSKPAVSCPIVGATRPKHLEDAVAALDVELTEDAKTSLEAPYTAQDNYWW